VRQLRAGRERDAEADLVVLVVLVRGGLRGLLLDLRGGLRRALDERLQVGQVELVVAHVEVERVPFRRLLLLLRLALALALHPIQLVVAVVDVHHVVCATARGGRRARGPALRVTRGAQVVVGHLERVRAEHLRPAEVRQRAAHRARPVALGRRGLPRLLVALAVPAARGLVSERDASGGRATHTSPLVVSADALSSMRQSAARQPVMHAVEYAHGAP
jgi:hypothetical protein